MNFRIHIKFIKKVEETGRWVKLFLKNGVILEDKGSQWELSDPWIIHYAYQK